MNRHVMIDIETTGLLPGCKILTIGAVFFDQSGVQGFDHFYHRINPYFWGMDYRDDPGTIKWWEDQDPVVKAEAFGGNELADDVLQTLLNWIERNEPVGIWCKGASFDFPILNFALKCHSLPELPYRKLRCYRTLLALAGNDDRKFGRGNAHNALDDAIQQAHGAVEALNILEARGR